MKLYDYQQQGVEQIQAAPLNRWILEFDTGLGKTATTLSACRTMGWQRVLVVAPAIARGVWMRELSKWWPEHPTAAAITLGRNRTAGVSKKGVLRRAEAYHAPVQVVSYDLAHEVELSGWDAIVVDELHRLQSPLSQQSKTLLKLTAANPDAAVVGLTATLMPNEIIDVWNPIDTMWSGRFGKRNKNGNGSWEFSRRYSNLYSNEYGRWFSGINQAHADELRMRLRAISTRVTKGEVAHLLPVLRVAIMPLSCTSFADAAAITPNAETVRVTLERAGSTKVGHAVEWATDAVRTSPACVLTHLRATAEVIAKKASAKHRQVFLITGDDPPEVRHKILEKARQHQDALLVATMHSVGISIDLTHFTQVCFAELYYRPETMIQALGRFQRLNGKFDCMVYIMVLAGTVDEIIGEVLLQKLEAINTALTVGENDSKLLEALQGPPQSDAELFASISDMLQIKAEEWFV